MGAKLRERDAKEIGAGINMFDMSISAKMNKRE